MRTPSRPNKVKIGPLDYSVEWRDDAWSQRYDRCGDCNSSLMVIGICENMPAFKIAAVFLHEVMHAIQDYSPCPSRSLTPEEACDLWGYGLVSFWRDNPDVFAWWSSLFTTEKEAE